MFSTPGLRKYIWVPLVLGLIFYAAMLYVSHKFLIPWLAGLANLGGIWETVANWAGHIGVTVLMLWLGIPIYLFVSSLFSSLMWERLSLRAEEHFFGTAPNESVGCGASLLDTLQRLLFAFVFVIFAVLFSWSVIIPMILTGLLCLFDFTCCPYLRRGITFPNQFGRALRLKGAFGFVICCAACSFFPILFLILLPGMVAGATLLCRETEGFQPLISR